MKEQEYYDSLKALEAELCYKYAKLEYPKYNISNFKYDYQYLDIYTELIDRYNLVFVAGNGTTLTKALNIMNWITKKTFYCGQSNCQNEDTLSILDYSYEKGFEFAIRCDQKSLVLSECLLALNIPAYILDFEEFDLDKTGEAITNINCHCCTHVYLKEDDRWIMLDPSFNAYFTNCMGEILNIIDLKNNLNKDEEVILSQYSLNGNEDIFRKGYPYHFVYNQSFRISLWDGNHPSKQVYNTNILFPKNIDRDKYYIMKQRANGWNEEDIQTNINLVRYISSEELLLKPQ